MKFHHILFPIDFSERCIAAASHVAEMAGRFGSEVTLLHVAAAAAEYDPATGMPIVAEPTFVMDWEVRQQLEAFAKRHLKDIKPLPVVARGETAAAIAKFAGERNVDLIMMPSHGYGPFRRLLLGSVTAKVLHDAQCPVWTGAHVEQNLPTDNLPCLSVICAVDLGPCAKRLMSWSSELATALHATLQFVHAVSPGISSSPAEAIPFQDLCEDAYEAIQKMQEEVGLQKAVLVGVGDPAAVIRQEATRFRADLIVIGRGCIGGVLGHFRTHAYSIIREAACPVISV